MYIVCNLVNSLMRLAYNENQYTTFYFCVYYFSVRYVQAEAVKNTCVIRSKTVPNVTLRTPRLVFLFSVYIFYVLSCTVNNDGLNIIFKLQFLAKL